MIRELELEDLEAYRRLFERAQPSVSLASEQRMRDLWTRIAGSSGVKFFGYFDESAGLIGTCSFAVVPSVTQGARSHAVIENLVIDPECRDPAIGRQLIAAAMRHAREAGCYKLMLDTEPRDPTAIGVYHVAGYDPNARNGFLAIPQR